MQDLNSLKMICKWSQNKTLYCIKKINQQINNTINKTNTAINKQVT